MNNYEIVDLILPEVSDTEKAKKELIIDYRDLWCDTDYPFEKWFPIFAPIFVRELKEIEKTQPKYDREFWVKVKELNKDNMDKSKLSLEVGEFRLWLNFEGIAINYFAFNELDLINKQYRLLQEIYYSRLEGK